MQKIIEEAIKKHLDVGKIADEELAKKVIEKFLQEKGLTILREIFNAPQDEIVLEKEEIKECFKAIGRDRKDKYWIISDLVDEEGQIRKDATLQDIMKFKSKVNLYRQLRPKLGRVFADERSYWQVFTSIWKKQGIKVSSYKKPLGKILRKYYGQRVKPEDSAILKQIIAGMAENPGDPVTTKK